MYSERQKQILDEITHGLGLPESAPDAVKVEQSPSYIDSVIETADFAAKSAAEEEAESHNRLAAIIVSDVASARCGG